MKKTYEPETKSAIEQVIDVFNDYIRTSTHFELLWSDKVGYIYISIDNVQGSIGDTGCCVVNCGEELFDKLVWELAVDIMECGRWRMKCHLISPIRGSGCDYHR